MAERIDNRPEFHQYPHMIARLDVVIPGLKPEIFDPYNGRVICPTNLADLKDKEKEEVMRQPWYKPLLGDVLRGRRSGRWIASAGVLTIFVAAVGFEYGLRHGRDLKDLPNFLGKE